MEQLLHFEWLVETPQITTQGASMLEKLKEHKPHWIIFQIYVNVFVTFEAFDH